MTLHDMRRAGSPLRMGAVATEDLLARAARHATEYLGTVAARPVGATARGSDLRRDLARPLPDRGDDPAAILDALAAAATTGTVASQGPRYFGFVTGGSVPIATATDWLVSAWDQSAQLYTMSPLSSVLEEVAAGWLKELLGVPPDWSAGFVTGSQMATFTAVVVARHHVLQLNGWDVERDGLFGAPPIAVLASDEAHRTVFTALRMAGLGSGRVTRIETDEQGRTRADALARRLAAVDGPCIVVAQAGNVHTGAVDPLAEIAALVRGRGGWLHVDGAFGLWAAASPVLRQLVAGAAQADSIAVDCHKWLNTPYDCGVVCCAHPQAHRESLTLPAHYLKVTAGERDARSYVPDESRRARATPVYATLRALGREGVRELVERNCALARRMADTLGAHPQVRILNDVVLNQVLVQLLPPQGDGRDEAAFTDAVVAEVQREGTYWLGASAWRGVPVIRISLSHWATTPDDIDRSAAAILAAVNRCTANAGGVT